MARPAVALALVAVLAIAYGTSASASVLLLKDADLNSAKGYANLKAYLKDATEVTTSLTADDLADATALVVDADYDAAAAVKASVDMDSMSGFYTAVGTWLKAGGNLILADGGAGGWLPVVSKFVGKAQNCTGVEFEEPKNTFARRVSKGPFKDIETWRKAKISEVPAGIRCAPGNGRTVLSTRPFQDAVSVVHVWAVGRGSIIYFGNTFEGRSLRTQYTDVLDIAIAIEPKGKAPKPAPTPAPKPDSKPSPAPAASPKPSPTPSPAASPKPSPTPSPASSPMPSPTPSPASSPSPSPTPSPSPSPSPKPSPVAKKSPPPAEAPPPIEAPPPMEEAAPPPKKKNGRLYY